MTSLREILSANFLSRGWFKRQYKLVILISALVFIYIYSGYTSLRQKHRLSVANQELQDAYNTHITLHAELMQYTRQSTVADLLSKRGSQVAENKKAIIHIQ